MKYEAFNRLLKYLFEVDPDSSRIHKTIYDLYHTDVNPIAESTRSLLAKLIEGTGLNKAAEHVSIPQDVGLLSWYANNITQAGEHISKADQYFLMFYNFLNSDMGETFRKLQEIDARQLEEILRRLN